MLTWSGGSIKAAMVAGAEREVQSTAAACSGESAACMVACAAIVGLRPGKLHLMVPSAAQ